MTNSINSLNHFPSHSDPLIDQVVVIQLINGQSIVGQFVAMDDATIALRKPIFFQQVMTSHGPQARVMAYGEPYVSTTLTDDVVREFKLIHVISEPMAVNDELAKDYASKTSVIQQVEKSLIVK